MRVIVVCGVHFMPWCGTMVWHHGGIAWGLGGYSIPGLGGATIHTAPNMLTFQIVCAKFLYIIRTKYTKHYLALSKVKPISMDQIHTSNLPLG